MMDTTKLVLRYFVVLQVYQGFHLVSSTHDADAASIPDKLCLPYDKSSLERYLKKLDTPEVSMSNTGSSLLVKDTESLPFGALSVDWRRLRLLSDLSTVPKPGIEKISSDKDFTGISDTQEEEAFLTTGNIRVPDEKRFHRSTLNNRNGNIDSTTMTVEPDTFDTWEEEVPSVTESGTDLDIEENSGLTGIPMFEEVEKSTELITTDSNSNSNSNPTTTTLTTVFKNTDSLVTTEEIKPDVTISVSSKKYEEESTDRQESEPFSSTTDVGTTKMTVILKIGEPFSSVPKFVENYGDRETNENRVSRVRNFGKSSDRHNQNRIDEALAKTRLSVFEPFDLGKKLRNRSPNSRRGNEGLVKRGEHNTNTEKLFRWFYRGERNPDDSEKLDAEIKCTERS